MSLGRSAGSRTCDSCRRSYPGPAYATYRTESCPLKRRMGNGAMVHPGCTENTCDECSQRLGIRPDRSVTEGDPR